MKLPGTRWPLRVGLVTLAAMAVLAGAVLLGGPRLLDLPSVKAGVERLLSRAANGHIAFDALRIRLLPAPHVEMEGVTLELPGLGNARIEQAQAGLRLRSLLRGQVELTSIAAVRPVLRIKIPPPAPTSDQTPTDPVAVYRSAMGSLVQVIQNAPTGALFEVSDADVLLLGTPVPELRIHGLSLRLRTDSTGFDLAASAGGNLWDRLSLTGRVSFADLSGNFGLELTHLDSTAWQEEWFRGGWLRLDIPRGDVRIRLVTDARTELRCELGVDTESLQIAHGAHGLPVSRSRLKGTAALRAQGIEVTLNELQMGSLLPAARGTLHMNSEGQKPRLEVEIPRLEVAAARDFTIALMAAERASVRRHAPRALGGAITELKLRSEGDNWNALIRLDHLAADAMLEQASVLLPFVEQEARELHGRLALADASVELADASAQIGPSRLSDARLQHSMRSGSVSASTGFDLDLPQVLTIARATQPQDGSHALDEVESAEGRLPGHANFASNGPNWTAAIEIAGSNASLRVRSLPWPVSLQAARTSMSPGKVSVSGLQLTAGSSKFADVGATVALEPEARLTHGSGRATLALDEIYPWLRSRGEAADRLGDIDSVSGNVQVELNNLSGPLGRPSELAYDAAVLPEQLRIGVKGWPAALALAGGAVHIDAAAVRVDLVSAAFLDARGIVSGEVAPYRDTGTRIRASLADATLGPECMHWIWQRAGAPAYLEPRAPLHIAVERVTWGPDRAVDAQGRVTFESGPALTVDLRWEPDVLDVRSLVIRDQGSEATFGLRLKDGLLEARFSGTIFARSIAAMLKDAGEYQGQASGELRMTLDLEHRGRSAAQGAITAQGLDLDELLPEHSREQLRVDRLDLQADGSSLQIREAEVRWAQQTAAIRGWIKREQQGIAVDVEVDSPGIEADTLVPRGGPGAADTGAKPPGSGRATFFSWQHAMGVSGRLRLQSNFVQFDRWRLAPVTATLTLHEERAELHLEGAQLCGLSFPMTVQIAPPGYTISAQIRAEKQQIEAVADCLTSHRVALTGEFDARADLTTSGEPGQHMANLEGTVHVEARNGTVRKFALIGNILAMTDVSQWLGDSRPDLRAEGFPYRTLDFDGRFTQGRLVVEDLTFDSSAFGLAAEGSVVLATRDTKLDVLVTPFSRITNLIRQVPIVGYVLGGTLTGIPVSVKGDIRDPTVVPLAPGAVASSLLGLVTRVFKLPARLLGSSGSAPAPAAPSSGQ